MRILIYGAGVLGSYLAHVLVRGGNDVTMLARGKRAEELKQDGLVIRHHIQRKTTVDRTHVIESLADHDSYDLIFVVMKYTDFPAILPILAKNRSRNIILVGNNTDAHQMEEYLQTHSDTSKHIAFGFQVSGGRREKDRMVAVRFGAGEMVIGGLNGDIPFKAVLDQAFAKTKYKLTYHDQMDAWLKNHIIPILGLNIATRIHGGQMNKVARDTKLLRLAIEAVDEGFQVLETLGYPLVPAKQAQFIRNRKSMMLVLMKIYHRLSVSRMIDGNFSEIEALTRVLNDWKNEASIPTPAWDQLQQLLKDKTGAV
ncbi:2-dehydropantoate 2-reductase N-terminal domain-containing protein [Paenibacillus cisolokensis]|uniref:ketopantoate reductase family protein n=1 Tax=Paenibacillus cisolokensis TaxID=1658519 RepID=UPI003D29D885